MFCIYKTKISTVLDDSSTDFDKYKSDVLQASTDTRIVVGEFSDAVYESISASTNIPSLTSLNTQAKATIEAMEM